MSDLKVFDSHSKCSEFWKEEVERCERKALQSSKREKVKAEESKEDESILWYQDVAGVCVVPRLQRYHHVISVLIDTNVVLIERMIITLSTLLICRVQTVASLACSVVWPSLQTNLKTPIL